MGKTRCRRSDKSVLVLLISHVTICSFLTQRIISWQRKQVFPTWPACPKGGCPKKNACQALSTSISVKVVLSLQVLQLEALSEKGPKTGRLQLLCRTTLYSPEELSAGRVEFIPSLHTRLKWADSSKILKVFFCHALSPYDLEYFVCLNG